MDWLSFGVRRKIKPSLKRADEAADTGGNPHGFRPQAYMRRSNIK